MYWCNGCGEYHNGEPVQVRTIQDANGRKDIIKAYCGGWLIWLAEPYWKQPTTAG